MSVALFNLKCPSYEYVKRMSWAEFLIRLHGFRREKDEDIMMLRELSWMVYTAPHNDPKKMKKSIDAFWPLNREVSDNRKERMQLALIEAQKNYLEEKKLKDGNSRS